ncbi:MAG: hypothetical protein U1F27_06355 [Turneriella sp.]
MFAQTSPAARGLLQRIELGLGIPVTYNTANANTTTKELRIGPAIAAHADFHIAQQHFSLLASFSKSQIMWLREDGSKNPDICNETFSMSLASFPGYCAQYQARLQPLWWFDWAPQPWLKSFSVGLSFVYNHFTDISYRGSRIYNTKWAYEALGIVGAYRLQRGRFSFMATAHFDFGLFSQTATIMTPAQNIQGLQAGVTIYGMYTFY